MLTPCNFIRALFCSFAATYKSELEGLLNEIILLSEIAELAMEADRESSIEESTGKDDTVKRPTLSKIRWKSLRFDDKTKQMDDGTLKSEIDVEEATDEESDDGEVVDELSGLHSLPRRSRQLKRHVSVIKNQLDRWEEPIDKSNEVRSNQGLFLSCHRSTRVIHLCLISFCRQGLFPWMTF